VFIFTSKQDEWAAAIGRRYVQELIQAEMEELTQPNTFSSEYDMYKNPSLS
jgi:hypothetical protein